MTGPGEAKENNGRFLEPGLDYDFNFCTKHAPSLSFTSINDCVYFQVTCKKSSVSFFEKKKKLLQRVNNLSQPFRCALSEEFAIISLLNLHPSQFLGRIWLC